MVRNRGGLKPGILRETIPRDICQVELDVEILDVERIVFDELPALVDVFSHEGCEDLVGLNDVFEVSQS